VVVVPDDRLFFSSSGQVHRGRSIDGFPCTHPLVLYLSWAVGRSTARRYSQSINLFPGELYLESVSPSGVRRSRRGAFPDVALWRFPSGGGGICRVVEVRTFIDGRTP
jgi:hypothetical protein